ncbi:MAG: hypothetical protein ACD_12C00241G0001 [uncultured bacterium]|nr:MAG: hypothetical protein ACD_12C00241G0001 [uncultured bacterium]
MEAKQTTAKSGKKLYSFKSSAIVFSGLPLTGKTTLAKRLAVVSNLEVIDVDVVREEIDETRKQSPSSKWLSSKQEKAIMKKAYAILCQRARERIFKGAAILLTATFSREEFKKPLKELYSFLQENNIPFKAFLLTAADEKIEKRIEQRRLKGSVSNVSTLEKYQWAKTIFKPINFVSPTKIDNTSLNSFNKVLVNLRDLLDDKNV